MIIYDMIIKFNFFSEFSVSLKLLLEFDIKIFNYYI
jgi:hypothetical protein